MGAYFIYDNFIKEKPAPTLPVSRIESDELTRFAEFSPVHDMGRVTQI
jgi:hypothetical protein